MMQTGTEQDKPFTVVGHADPLLENVHWRGGLYLFEQGYIVFVGHIHPQSGLYRQLMDPLLGMLKVGKDILLYLPLRGFGEYSSGQPWEITPLKLVVVGAKVAEKVDFLKGGPQTSCIGSKTRVKRVLAFAKHPQAHETNRFRAAEYITAVGAGIVPGFIKICFHTREKGLDQVGIDVVLFDCQLKAVKDGIETDAFLDGRVGLQPESGKQLRLVVMVECIDNLIGQPHKTIDGINGITQIAMKETDRRSKRSAVTFGDDTSATAAHVVKQIHH